MKKYLFTLSIIALAMLPASAQKRKTNRTRTTKPKIVYVAAAPQEITRSIVVPASNYWSMPLNVPAQGFRIKGRFEAQGGTGNDIEMFVLDADGLENWKNGHTVNAFFNSGRLTVKSFDFMLGQGQYFVVFNNKFSWMTPKAVTITFYPEN